nr:S8 family serine peptidase [uncultured Methanospirillum sp.]
MNEPYSVLQYLLVWVSDLSEHKWGIAMATKSTILVFALFVLCLIICSSLTAGSQTIPTLNQQPEDTTISTNVDEHKTQGDILVRSNGIREVFGVAGKGIRVGVIANGAQSINISQKNGELSTVHVLAEGTGDEGTAMLEIIHDIAPDAELYFYAYGSSSDTFKTAVTGLANAGCNVICDDLYFFRQPFLQDGDVADHIRSVLKANPRLIYVTVSGNFAPLHYQGPWKPGQPYGKNQTLQDFGGGACAVNITLLPEERVIATLQWDDPWGHSFTDYDLVLTDPRSGTVLATSNFTQNGTTDPFEHLVYDPPGPNAEKVSLQIVRNGQTGTPNTLELFIRGVDAKGVDNAFMKDPTDSIFGHAAVEEVVTVGSVEPAAPFTISPDSSHGPVTIRYPVSTKRWKPDICAPTNVNVSGAGNFPNPFPGTSAAAPHVAGVIAQLWSAFPDVPRDQLKQTVYQSADDLGAPGWDEVYGYGLLNAERAYRLLFDKNKPTFDTSEAILKP